MKTSDSDKEYPALDFDSFPYVYGSNIEHLYPNVRITIEMITPSIAKEMMVANIGNRNPKREPLAKAIKSGEWTLNGATIVFDENGILIDGQNRLMACIKTGMPIETIVVRGIKKSAQITMDSGCKRQLSDYLKMDGYTNCTTVGAIGLKLYCKDVFGLDAAFNKAKPDQATIKTVYEFIRKNYESRIEPLVHTSMMVRNEFKGFESGTCGVLFDTFRTAGDENLNEFIDQLLYKKAACSSIRLLQGRLRSNADSKQGRLPQKVIAALTIKAWNAYMRGDEVTFLRFTQGGARPESFPEIYIGYDW